MECILVDEVEVEILHKYLMCLSRDELAKWFRQLQKSNKTIIH